VIEISDELKDQILGNLVRAVEMLKASHEVGALVPEVRMNIAYSLPNPGKTNDIAAIPGRISTYRGILIVNNYPAFGGSDHLARALLEVQKFNPAIRAVINFKFTHDLSNWLEEFSKQEDLIMVCVDRAEEPTDASEIDGKSMPWKIQRAIKLANNRVPDLMGETEAPGKEPLFKLFGTSATDVAQILIKIAKAWVEKK
jgi:predicted fused transcriptional regulator/phosphomethylpyrimidine kinase